MKKINPDALKGYLLSRIKFWEGYNARNPEVDAYCRGRNEAFQEIIENIDECGFEKYEKTYLEYFNEIK